MFWYLLFVTIFLCCLHILFNCNPTARSLRRIPGPKEWFIFGDAIALISCSSVQLMQLARSLARENKGIYRLWTFPFGAVNIYNAADAEVVLSNMKFHEKSEIYKLLSPWLGSGLLLSKGSKWQHRRKILTPAFHFNILRQFSLVIEENARRLVDTLGKRTGRPVDVVPILSQFTLNSICETAMGTQLSEDVSSKSYKEAIYDMGFIFYQRFSKFYYLFDFIFNLSPLGKKQKRYLEKIHGFTKRVIKERKENAEKNGFTINDSLDDDHDTYVYKKKKTAMLDLLLSAEKAGLIDGAGVQEEVDTFMFEGHDTTASGLTFCFMLLANNKQAQDKIYEELRDIFGDSNRSITMEDLSHMRYLDRCVKESLRLYPPVHFISRNLKEKVTLSNYDIPAGTFCHVHIYDLHHRADLFENPDKFDPDRFLPENSVGRHPYAYIPFSAGARNCIGQKFAMMEMKMAVAQVLREFELLPVTRPSDINILTDLVLRNDGPVEVTFMKRQ